MATRNRTAVFRKYRDALRQVRLSSDQPSLSSSAMPSSSGPVIELATAPFMNQRAGYSIVSGVDMDNPQAGAVTVGLPPAWVDISEEISDDMQRARTRMNELVKAHAKALRPIFGDNKGEQQMIESLTREITTQLKKCEKNLQRLSVGTETGEDANLRKNVQRSLATNLQSLSMEFRKQQKGYLERLRQQQDSPSGADLGVDLNGHRSILIDDDDDLEPRFESRQHLSQVKRLDTQAAEREKEIIQIVESVNDLAQIMKDLSVLVIDQGTIVDRIDYNIQNVASSVEQGVKQLERAERTQKQGGMVLCVMILICLCIFMIFLLIVKSILF